MRYLRYFILLILISINLPASEIDQFTDREKYQDNISNFTGVLNHYTDERIREAVNNFNKRYSKKNLTQNEIHQSAAFEIYKVMAGNHLSKYVFYVPSRVDLLYAAIYKSGQGTVQKWIKSKENESYLVYLQDNIYSTSYPDIVNQNYVIKVGGEIIGTDKVDHFFDQGYSYWVVSDFGRDDMKAKKFGVDAEKGWYGLQIGGVFSFADLRANWGGYQFYKNLFSGDNPLLLISDDGSVHVRRNFDWAEYIDWQFDELKNPSLYSNFIRNRIYKYVNVNIDSYRVTTKYLDEKGLFSWGKKRDMFYITDNIEYRDISYYEIIRILLDSNDANMPLPMVKNIFSNTLEFIRNSLRSIIEDS